MYRSFVEPQFSRQPHTTAMWTDWMRQNRMLHDFMPSAPGLCGRCGGVCDPTYPECYLCSQVYAGQLNDLFVCSYSFMPGLESLLHKYKDWANYEWAAKPLASLLDRSLAEHRECFALSVGVRDVVYTWVPSNNPRRTFDHLKRILDTAPSTPSLPWEDQIIARSSQHDRPARRQLAPEAYVVNRAALAGRSVVLLDDVWTTGASMASAAAALRDAGAANVVGLVLGRQLNRSYREAESAELYEEIDRRDWTNGQCSLTFNRCPSR